MHILLCLRLLQALGIIMRGHKRAQEWNYDSCMHFFYECVSLCIANVTVNILYRLNAWLLSHLMEALFNNEVMEPYKEWMLFQTCQGFKNLHGWKSTWQSKLSVWVCMARRASVAQVLAAGVILVFSNAKIYEVNSVHFRRGKLIGKPWMCCWCVVVLLFHVELGLFCLEKKRFLGALTIAFQYLKGIYEKNGSCFNRTRDNGSKQK